MSGPAILRPATSASAITIIAARTNFLGERLVQALRDSSASTPVSFSTIEDSPPSATDCVYLPSTRSGGFAPDLSEAQSVFEKLKQHPRKIILISSALVYGAWPGRLAMVQEDFTGRSKTRDSISADWRQLESLASLNLDQGALTILRPVTVLASQTPLGRNLLRRFVVTLPGHDPVLQLLSISDLAQAILRVLQQNQAGIFNVAPDGVVPLHEAIRQVGSFRMPVPRTLQRLFASSEKLDYFRYPWTVSNQRLKKVCGFVPQKSSMAALEELSQPKRPRPDPEPRFDDFGMDHKYIVACEKILFRFLSWYYWRIEARGLEHLPRKGPAVLVGTHRGFIPWDGVMAVHLIAQTTGRVPRFLTHSGLLKFPFIANFVTKLGGVPAWQENAERILENGEILGVFPEGTRGAFALYRDAYKLQSFGRDTFIKLALRYRVPIIPFVTVGSAEIFPVFWQIKSPRWTRYSDWPCLPISTFPFCPLPLPSKWHTRFLAPIEVGKEYPAKAAEDSSVVKAIGLRVRNQMQSAMDEMRARRPSIFFGSVFGSEEE